MPVRHDRYADAGPVYHRIAAQLAQCSHLYSVIRSNINRSGGHPDAGNYSLTGYPDPPARLRRNFGSIVVRHRGGDKVSVHFAGPRQTCGDVVRPTENTAASGAEAQHPFVRSETGQLDIPASKPLDGLSRPLVKPREPRQIRRRPAAIFGQWGSIFTLGESNDGANLAEFRRPAAFTSCRIAAVSGSAPGPTSHRPPACAAAGRSQRALHSGETGANTSESMTPNCDFGCSMHIYNFDLLPDRHCPILDRAFVLLDDLHDRRSNRRWSWPWAELLHARR